MSEDSRQSATAVLQAISSPEGSAHVPKQLLPIVYPELRRLAGAYLNRERPGHTLQPTELVHEAYLKLVDQTRVDWQGRTHFFAVAANAMRRILVDHARRKSRQKRGGDGQHVTLQEDLHFFPTTGLDAEDLIVLDDALTALAELDQRQSEVVEMRVFGGMTVEQVAGVLGVSKRTIEGEWAHAKAWLRRRMSVGSSE
jgi:RNA polymerase sigma factor (TIGR02999 family)